MRFFQRRSILSVGLFLAGPLCSDVICAQVLDEVVVTARKREENIQDIPVSITAFSGEEIEKAGFVDLEDVSMHTPGMQVNTELAGSRPGRLFSSIRFRGVEGSEFSSLQTASMYVDGIFSLMSAQSLAITDLERIEVIKGPQSAAFGRNSFAGAINYITSTPSFEKFSGKVRLDGATYDQYQIDLSVEGPIIEDKLALRVGGRLYSKGEMYTASDGGALGEQSTRAVFASLYAEPTERLSFKLRAYYQEDEDGPPALGFLQGRFNDTCTGTTRGGLDAQGNPVTLTPRLFLCGTVPNRGEPMAPPVDSNTSLFPISFTGNPRILVDRLLPSRQVDGAPSIDQFGLERYITRLSLVGEYAFAGGMSLAATAAYNENKAANLRDFDMTPVESWYVSNPQTGEDKSIDLRLASSPEQRLRWLGGFNYYEQEFITSNNAGITVHRCANFAGLLDPTGASGGPCDFPGVFPVGLDGGDFIEVWSVYGSASFDITRRVTLDAELRYQNDERNDGLSDFSATFKSYLPRVSLSVRPTEDITLYATASEGILPGVLNASFINCQNIAYTSPFTDPRTGQPSTSSECQQYREALGGDAAEITEEQNLDSFELGAKTTWAGGRVRANVAAYYMEWKEAPYAIGVTTFRDDNGDGVPNTNPNFFSVAVPGSSEYYGIELETRFVPVDGWTIGFNWSYNENEFTEFLISRSGAAAAVLGTTNIKGNRSSRFPKWSGNLSSDFTRQLSNDWAWYVVGDVIYHGEAPTGDTNLAIADDYYLVDARLGIEKDDLSLELYVKNLFDEDTWRTAQDFTDFSLFGTGFDFTKQGIILVPQDRRTLGIRATMRF